LLLISPNHRELQFARLTLILGIGQIGAVECDFREGFWNMGPIARVQRVLTEVATLAESAFSPVSYFFGRRDPSLPLTWTKILRAVWNQLGVLKQLGQTANIDDVILVDTIEGATEREIKDFELHFTISRL